MDIALTIIVSVLIPLFAFWANWAARRQMGYELSAAADFVLAIFAFDLGAMAAGDVFKQAMHSTIFQKDFYTVFIILFIVTAVAWASGFLRLEHYIETVVAQNNPAPSFFKNPTYLKWCSWGAITFVMAPHIFAFAYR